MRALFFITCALLTVNLLHSINVSIDDDVSQYHFTSSMTFAVAVRRDGPLSEWEREVVSAARSVRNISREVNGNSVFYKYAIDSSSNSTMLRALELTIEAQMTDGRTTHYIREFELSVTFSDVILTRLSNWTGSDYTFVVRPPRFPHFRVKPDWQYSCPKQVAVRLCRVTNGTTSCSIEAPYNLMDFSMTFDNTLFYGGKELGYDYKVEECPIAYQTRPDIGIACIVAFWSIVLAALLWGVIKFLIKRNRKMRGD